MVKCEEQTYCYGNKATAKCSDCGKKYCDECASNKGWNCDCIEHQNIIALKTSQKTSKSSTAQLPKGFKEGKCKCGNSYGYCGSDVGYCVKCIDKMEIKK